MARSRMFGGGAGELTFGEVSGWNEEPLLVAEEIDIAELELRKFYVPLRIARRYVRDSVQRRFDTETDPDGNPWAPYSENYAPRAKRENVSKLRKSPAYHRDEGQPQLYDAATKTNAYIVESHSLTEGAYAGGDIALIGEALPDYWVHHQDGTSKMPARPFIGLDDEAEQTIVEVFDAHVDRSLAGVVRSSGQPIIRTERGPRFASYGIFGN